MTWLFNFKYFLQNRGVARIRDFQIRGRNNEIEKSLEDAVPVSFGGLFFTIGQWCEEGMDIIRSYGIKGFISELLIEF